MKKESRHALLIEAILKDVESQAKGYGRLDESDMFDKKRALKSIAKFFYSLFSGRFAINKDDVSNYENEFWAEGAQLDILVNYMSKIFVESYLVQNMSNFRKSEKTFKQFLRRIENTAKQFDEYYSDNKLTQRTFRPLHVLLTINKNLEEMGENHSDSPRFKSKNNPDEDVYVFRGSSQDVNKAFASDLGQIMHILESIGTFVEGNNRLNVSSNIDELAKQRGVSKNAIYAKWLSQGKDNIRFFNRYKQFFKATLNGPSKPTPAQTPVPEPEPEPEPKPIVEEKPEKGFLGRFFGRKNH